MHEPEGALGSRCGGNVIRGYVNSTSGQVHYREVGTGDEVVVLLHQTASSSRMYERFMTQLAGEFRLIALDTPGFGESDPWPEQPTTGDLAGALAAAVQGLGIDSYHLLGHHTGAALACEWAATHRDRVRSLAMSGPLAIGPEKAGWWDREDFQAGLRGSAILLDGTHLVGAWDRAGNLDPSPVEFPPETGLRHREALDTVKASPRWPETYRAVFAQDFEAHLAAVACPVLVLAARADVLWPYFSATVAAKPGCQSVELPGGAYVFDQQTELVADAMRRFLASVAASSGRKTPDISSSGGRFTE
jgi:pimeloyl-ACP methyl ester carboxylesterase